MIVFAAVVMMVSALMVLSCGPTAPDGDPPAAQDQRTSPQTRDQGTPAPEASPTLEPTPTPGPTPKLHSHAAMTMYRLTEEANRNAAAGSGTSDSDDAVPLPTTIFIYINVLPPEQDDLKQFLSDNGATNIEPRGEWGLSADMPPLLFGAVTRHPGHLSSFTSGLYGDKMGGTLDEKITMYVAGELTADEAAARIRGADVDGEYSELVTSVEVGLAAASDQATVKKYITDNEGFVHPNQPVDAVVLDASVPVSAFPGLYTLSEVVSIKRKNFPVGSPQPDPRNSPEPPAPGLSDPSTH